MSLDLLVQLFFITLFLTSANSFVIYSSSRYNLLRSSHGLELYSTKIAPDGPLYSHIKVAVLGGGAFSLALCKVLSYKNITTSLLVRQEVVAEEINLTRHHPKYLTTSEIPPQVTATSRAEEAIRDANYIVHAVPMQSSRSFLTSVKHLINPKVPILSVTKGVEQTTFCLMNDIIVDVLGPTQRAAYLSGPSFAREIMNGEATAVVIASDEGPLAKELAVMLSSVEFRCHTSKDVKVSAHQVLFVNFRNNVANLGCGTRWSN